jgi:hypothetical protein
MSLTLMSGVPSSVVGSVRRASGAQRGVLVGVLGVVAAEGVAL